jgi:hypothetical protein
MSRHPLAREGIISVPEVPFRPLVSIPLDTPLEVFIGRPNPMTVLEDGNIIAHQQDTANEGHGLLVAWLYDIGSRERRFGHVMLPSNHRPRAFAPRWIDLSGKVAAIRIWPTQPWRSAVA